MTLKSPKLTRLLSASATFMYLTVVMSCAILLSSCQKTTLSSDLYTESGQARPSIVSLPINQQRFVYPSLMASDKCAAWKFHLDYALSLPSKFTERQINYLIQLRNVLTPNLFETIPSSSSIAIVNSYKHQAQQLFDKPTASFLFGSLTSIKELQAMAKDGPEDQFTDQPSCNCSTDSDFCFGFSDCVSKNEECKSDKSNCGFLWRYLCNGLCQ